LWVAASEAAEKGKKPSFRAQVLCEESLFGSCIESRGILRFVQNDDKGAFSAAFEVATFKRHENWALAPEA
jgi:hypothetical protein